MRKLTRLSSNQPSRLLAADLKIIGSGASVGKTSCCPRRSSKCDDAKRLQEEDCPRSAECFAPSTSAECFAPSTPFCDNLERRLARCSWCRWSRLCLRDLRCNKVQVFCICAPNGCTAPQRGCHTQDQCDQRIFVFC